MIGHSFGGGVAIKLARNQPELVRYLVLLNAIGGLSARYPWEWAIGLRPGILARLPMPWH